MEMIDLHGLEKRMWSDTFLVREDAAMKLAEEGERGARVLAKIATDQGVPAAVRVTAIRHLKAFDGIEHALASLLTDALPVLRVWALEKTQQTHSTGLRSTVKELTRDPARFWDLDEEISVAEVATRVLEALED
jgi:hypothetical protein